ncbi:MAG: efflux RND transporter permease subunit, partial [Leptospiraceae bacterium]|nr:efflux RND transporter permease subunit [Leptospiraceae bacterium]
MQNQNWTGKIAQTFVTNKRLSLLLMVSLFIWGAFSFWNTPRQYNPKITAPAFRIQVDFPGASRSEVLEQVTKPLENTLAQIPAIEDIFSVTVEGGMASIIANFYVGEDEDSAKITLNDRIQSDLNLAPLGIQPPRIESINPDDVPVLVIALESQSVSPGDLRKFAFRLRDKLINVEGTSRVEIIGGKRTQLAIEIDPLRLARNNLGFSQIENALRRNNFFLPSGVIKQKDVYIPLQTTGVIESAAELRNLVIQSSDIQNVYLG